MFRLFAFGGLRLEGTAGPVNGTAAQPHPLAILAVLAAAGVAGSSRDRLVGLLWPDRTEKRARHVLSQSLYALRRSLGADDLLAPNGTLRLNPAVISSDVGDFNEAIRTGDDDRAIALYTGAFLEFFYLSGAPEFEPWTAGERDRLSRQYATALERAARGAAAAGNQARSIELLQKRSALDPLDSSVMLQLLQTMDAAGDRAAAMRRGSEHQELVQRELGIAASREIAQFLDQLRKARYRYRSPTSPTPPLAPITGNTATARIAAPASAPASAPGESDAWLASHPSANAAVPLRPDRLVRRRTVAAAVTSAMVLGVAVALSSGRDEPNGLPQTFVRAVTNRPPLGRSLYQEGLRAFYAADVGSARRLFSAALTADPTFAMAAHYLALTAIEAPVSSERYVTLARRLAQRSPDRERLLILHFWAAQFDDPVAFAYADTLIRRYPTDAESQLAVARTRLSQGDFPEAIQRLRGIISAEGGSPPHTGVRCRACEARSWLVFTLELADSLSAAEQLVRESLRTEGDSRAMWGTLGTLLERQGRLSEADSAYARESAFAGGTPEATWRPVLWMRRGDFAASEGRFRRLLVESTGPVRDRAQEMLAAVLRNRGRPRAALQLAQAIQRQAFISTGGRATDPFVRLPLALALMQSGRGREAAAQFDTMAALSPFKSSVARTARHRAWMMAHRARSLAIAGDTAALAPLADTVREVGARSAYGRDQRLHYYVRGLLYEARRDWPSAVEAFRRARYSSTETYLAVPLARAELAVGEARSAVQTASAALRGPMDSQNQYELRSELHEVLADALLAVRDSGAAARNYQIVADAWQGAEPPFAQRGRRAREQWRSLTGSRSRTDVIANSFASPALR